MNSIPALVLPQGFSFCDQSTITTQEIMTLRGKIGWAVENQAIWQRCISQSLAVVGVCDKNNRLIGIGFLTGSIRHAILCDFAVVPEFQNKGIGTAILYKRLIIANELNVRYIYTDLAKTNPLRSKYIKLGFEETGGGLFCDTTKIKLVHRF